MMHRLERSFRQCCIQTQDYVLHSQADTHRVTDNLACVEIPDSCKQYISVSYLVIVSWANGAGGS